MYADTLANVLAHAIKDREAVLITGQPGTGKSDVVEQARQKAGAELVMFHGVTADPTDVKGIPWVEKIGQDPSRPWDTTGSGLKADFVPFGDLKKLIDATSPTVCFLDDFGQAPPLVQASWMQLVLAYRLGEHVISPHVTFLAATNRRKDNAAVGGILEPVKGRFAIVELQPSVDSWSKWALANNIPVQYVAFARFKDEVITGYQASKDLENTPTPRNYVRAIRWAERGLDPGAELEMLCGCLGKGMGAELQAYLKVWRALPSPDQIMLNPAGAPVPDEPSVRYAVTAILAKRTTLGNFQAVMTYIDRLPKDYGVCYVKIATARDASLTGTQTFIQWAAQNGDVML